MRHSITWSSDNTKMKRFLSYFALFSVIFGACFVISAPVQAMEEAIQDAGEYQHSHDHNEREPSEQCHDQVGVDNTVLQHQIDNNNSTNFLTSASRSSIPYFSEKDDNQPKQIDPPNLLLKKITTVRIIS